jgi:hypothetical protein
MDRTCLSYWYPRIEQAGLPVPRTEIVRCPNDLTPLLDGKTPEGWDKFLAELETARAKIGGDVCFLRTGQTSAKHDWKRTCLVPKDAKLSHHVGAIVEFSACADFFGLATDVWAVREMLPTMPVTVCPYYADMPVCREFRFFAASTEDGGGVVRCCHPYWPRKSLEQGKVDIDDDVYEQLCRMPDGVRESLYRMARVAAQACGGEWSVDILETKNGWYLTDMAEAGISWHWPECPNARKGV